MLFSINTFFEKSCGKCRQKENEKLSSELIYRDEAKNFLKFCREKLTETITESELFEIQKEFFKVKVSEELKFGEHFQSNCNDGNRKGILNIVKEINKAAFEQLGKFRLIDEDYLGFEFRYYIPKNEQDEAFEELQTLTQIKNTRNYQEAMQKRIAIETKLKEISARIVTFRVKNENLAPVPEGEEVCKTRKLGDLSKYTFERGIELRANAGFII